MSVFDHIRIVLTRPLYGGNIGSVCRAMANMGFSDLAIAGPRPIDEGEARMMACHAGFIFESRTEYPDLASAVSDCVAVAGTTARLGLYRQQAQAVREWAPSAWQRAASGRVAVVFGPEDNGLSNEDVALCTDLIRIPTTEQYSSLNLSQAVLICCYEMFLVAGDFASPEEKSPLAPSEFRERMFELWREALLEIGFMKEDKAAHMMLGLRRVLARGTLTVDDVKILMGIARQTLWAAKHGAE